MKSFLSITLPPPSHPQLASHLQSQLNFSSTMWNVINHRNENRRRPLRIPKEFVSPTDDDDSWHKITADLRFFRLKINVNSTCRSVVEKNEINASVCGVWHKSSQCKTIRRRQQWCINNVCYEWIPYVCMMWSNVGKLYSWIPIYMWNHKGKWLGRRSYFRIMRWLTIKKCEIIEIGLKQGGEKGETIEIEQLYGTLIEWGLPTNNSKGFGFLKYL